MADKKQSRYNNPVQAILTGIRDLFRKQKASGELKPTDRLDNKTVVIDGASSGLGFAIATGLAQRGAKVIMACRSGIPEKGEAVKMLSGSENVHMVHVDLRDMNSIRNLAIIIHEKFAPLDLLILNAGVVSGQGRKTPQGLEEMFMVNYLAKFLFIKLMLVSGCFRHGESGIPRIIFISSESHRNPKEINWDSFGKFEPYSMGKSMEHYGHNKLLLTTFAFELSHRLNPGRTTNYSVFAVCPGPVNSNIARESPKIFHPLLRLIFRLFFRSPGKAAIPVLYLAASPDFEGKSFDYLFLMSRKTIDEKASDPSNGKKLWAMSEELLKNFSVF